MHFHFIPFAIDDTAAQAWLLTAVYVAAAAAGAVHALLTKPDPRSTFGWIVVCWMFPLVGALL
ncbi:MAG: hypothetical protein ACRET0_03630, partial [Steroidobacteraceae bacterium]